MPIIYRDAVPGDYADIVPHLRAADVEEWREASGKTPAEHLRDNTWRIEADPHEGTVCRVALDASGPVILYGVDQSDIPGWGWVWLIACNRVEQHILELHRAFKSEVTNLLHMGGHEHLWTASWVGNPRHHDWLRWIGFKPFGVPVRNHHGGPFQPFIYGD